MNEQYYLSDLSILSFIFQTHICVEQTAIELLSRNLKVHIIADASTSRNQADRFLALDVSFIQSTIITTLRYREILNFTTFTFLTF